MSEGHSEKQDNSSEGYGSQKKETHTHIFQRVHRKERVKTENE